jgi:hypothetical protein
MKTIFTSFVKSIGFVKNSRILFMLFFALIFNTKFSAAHVNATALASPADLAVSDFTFGPLTIVAGAHPGSVLFKLTNNGPSNLSIPNTLVDGLFYISRNNIFGDGDDIQIGINNYDFTIASGSFYNVSLSPLGLAELTIPESALGSYYVFVRIRHNPSSFLTDPTPGNDYIMSAGTITVVTVKADLYASNFSFSPQTINANTSPGTVTFRLTNNGPANLVSPNTNVKGLFYISRNSVFGDGDDIPIGTNSYDFTLASGFFSDVVLSAANLSDIKIPGNASGNYYVFVKVQHNTPSVLVDPTAGNDNAMMAGTIFVVNTNADLSVSNFSFFPQTINAGAHPDSVSFRLINNGPANMSSPNTLTDAVFFISRNGTFGDTDDIPIGIYSSDNTLPSGSSADVPLAGSGRSGITIPANSSGIYYVFIKVRHNSSSLLTDPTATNDFNVRAGTITVLNSGADLAASNFSFLPDTMNAGAHPGIVTFRLTNNGPSDLATPNTRVDGVYYMSRNSIQGDVDDFEIGINSFDNTLASGSYADITLSAAGRSDLTIPASATGKYFVFVRVRHNSASTLTDSYLDNNYGRRLGTIFIVNPNADLAVSDFTFMPQSINSGATPDAVSYRLTNNGPTDLASPDTRVDKLFYISRNTVFGDTDDIQIGKYSSEDTLAAGSFIDVTLPTPVRSNIKIPAGASGVYSVFIKVQHSSPSKLTDPVPLNNYIVRAGTITVVNTNADLAVTNFSFTPQSINAGAHPDTVSFRLTNNGPTDLALPDTRVATVVYISRNNIYGDTDDIQLGINSFDFNLASGSFTDVVLSASGRSNITIPTSAIGNYYVFVRVLHNTPSVLKDTIPANNYAVKAGIINVKNTASDLAASNFVFLPATINAGSNPDSISFRLTNSGPADLASPNTRVDGVFYISPNNVYGDADDILIGTNNFNYTLAAGSYADVALSAISRSNITIPLTALGNYYVFVRVLHKSPSVLSDTNPGNDYALRLGTITILQPCNLAVLPTSLSFSFSADSKALNVTADYSWTVTDNADWISVLPTSGSNNGILTVAVTENAGITRIGIISVTGCGKTISINVQQDEFSLKSIKQIQGEAGYSPYVGTYQRILGTVSGVVAGKGYFIQDANAAWSGIWVADKVNFVLEGNGVKVDGTIQEVNDVTTINAAKVQIVNPPVSVLSIPVVSPEAAKSEQYESVLVKISGARFQGSLNLDGSWPIKTTELNRVFVSNLMFQYSPMEGHFYNVTGIMNGNLSNYRIEPRKEADIVDLTTTTPVVSSREQQVKVFPNPFKDHLNIINSEHLTRLTLTDMTGRTLLDVMHPQSAINTANLMKGIYIVRLYKDSSIISTEKFVRE